MTTRPIDLRSDTVTRPTAAMRRVMADAEVGDDVLDGDPTVRRLEAVTCELLGKERALFFPSGTMANQAALWLLARRGTDVLVDATSHVIDWELAGAAAIAGVQARPVAPRNGERAMDAAALADALAAVGARASLVCVENTHNAAGGAVQSRSAVDAIADVVRAHRLPLHLDGARLWNAAAATGDSEATLAAPADTVMVSFSKGLGAPVGAALAGSPAAMADAWDVRKRLGGGMRQSGVLAAAALHGIAQHRARLTDDHARARTLADLVDGAGDARVVAPETNILMIDLPAATAKLVAAATAREGVLVTAWSPTRLRVVTHLDVDDAQLRRGAEVLASALEGARGAPVGVGPDAYVSARR